MPCICRLLSSSGILEAFKSSPASAGPFSNPPHQKTRKGGRSRAQLFLQRLKRSSREAQGSELSKKIASRKEIKYAYLLGFYALKRLPEDFHVFSGTEQISLSLFKQTMNFTSTRTCTSQSLAQDQFQK
jgi:hypothetical protein